MRKLVVCADGDYLLTRMYAFSSLPLTSRISSSHRTPSLTKNCVIPSLSPNLLLHPKSQKAANLPRLHMSLAMLVFGWIEKFQSTDAGATHE
jgi:hypothetical protein